MTPTPLETILGRGYEAFVLGKGSREESLKEAQEAFAAAPALAKAARTELARLEAIGPNLSKRCHVSTVNRDFLKMALAEPARQSAQG